MRRHDRTRPRQLCLIGLLVGAMLALGSAAAMAQVEAAPAQGDGEVREAIKRYFENRLRKELQLSDAQVAQILPRVEAMEQARTDTRRERTQIVRNLRRGLDGGADDEELAGLLRRLERLENEQRDRERDVLRGIDGDLSVRQQVQLRFFVEEFRRELQRRVRSIRSGQGRGIDRIGGPAGRKPGAAGGRR